MQTPTRKILVVDDDSRLRKLLDQYLTEQGFAVTAVGDASGMDKQLERQYFDLLILDLMLPGEDGLQICRRLRANNSPLPILMLTAKKDDVDRIVGLEMGADDYLPKPFNPRELVARMQAILRRSQLQAPAAAPAQNSGTVNFGAYCLDLASRQLTRDNQPVSLTSGQFALLKALVAQPHQPLSRETLCALIKKRDREPSDRSLDVQISRLRNQIEDNAAQPRYIQTVWGYGYVFVPDGTASAAASDPQTD